MRCCARAVLHLVHVGADARHEGDVVGGEVGEFELHQLRIVAKAALGFAPERISQCRFSREVRVCEAVELVLRWLAASDDAEAFGDQRNDEQQEAREHSRECGEVAQHSGGSAAFVLHGRDYTAAFSPAGLSPLFPPTGTTVFPQTRR